MKKLLLCVLALGCAAVLMACEWSAVPLPLDGDEPQVSPAPDPSEITGQLAEYTSDHVDMALTIPDGWAFETLEKDGQAGLRFWKTDDDAVDFRLTCWLDGYGICGTGVTEQELLTHALALEQKSEHPLARAVLDRAAGLTAPEVSDFQALPGNGLTAVLEGKALWGGSAAFTAKRAAVSQNLQVRTEELSRQGKTPLFFGAEDRLLGVIAVADVIKEDSPRAVRELRNMGIRVVMLTGDNQRTAQAIGAQAGVDQVIAGVLPEGKEAAIRRLMQQGKVAMVGDGINDAPALTRADTGIAIGAGADVAIDAADVVLMNSSLLDVPAAIRLSRATLRNIHENLFWAFFYNAIGIPLAAGVFIPFGLTLNPMFGAAAMSLSSFCVVSNALRLNLFKLLCREQCPAAEPVRPAQHQTRPQTQVRRPARCPRAACSG